MLENPSFNVDFLFAASEGLGFEEVYGEDCRDIVVGTETFKRALFNDEMGSGTIQTDKGLMILVASPVYDSNGENPKGVYLVGRLLDEGVLHDIKRSLGFAETIRVSFDLKPKYAVTETDSYENLRISKEILIGESSLYVNMELKVPVYRYMFVNIQDINHLIIIVVISIFAAFILFVLKKTLKYTSKTLVAVEGISKGDYSNKIDIKVNRIFPELDNLAQSVNRMSGDLKKQSEIIHQDYTDMVELVVKGVEMNDSYTYRHSFSVAKYAVAIGRVMNFDAIDDLETASKFHDVGKISIPTQILNKPGKLTEEEYEIVMRHPMEGYNMISKIKNFDGITMGVRHHHERYDGKGYPNGLKGDEIPKMAQIIAVADNYDAMTSDRVYRKAMSREKAISIIKENSGKMFSPDVVEAFLQYTSIQNEKEENA
jgi:HD-GYP domain-containing protein (c-di-GMP phosphodiesterase class II)